MQLRDQTGSVCGWQLSLQNYKNYTDRIYCPNHYPVVSCIHFPFSFLFLGIIFSPLSFLPTLFFFDIANTGFGVEDHVYGDQGVSICYPFFSFELSRLFRFMGSYVLSFLIVSVVFIFSYPVFGINVPPRYTQVA